MAKIPLQIVLTLCLQIQRLRVDATSKGRGMVHITEISTEDLAAESSKQSAKTAEFSVDPAGNVDKGIVRKVAFDVMDRSDVSSKQDASAREYSIDFVGHVDFADKALPARDPVASMMMRKAPINAAAPRNVSPAIVANIDTISPAREYGAGVMPNAASTGVGSADWISKQHGTVRNLTVATWGTRALARAPAALIRPHGEAALISPRGKLKDDRRHLPFTSADQHGGDLFGNELEDRSQAQSAMPLSIVATDSATAAGITTTAPIVSTTGVTTAPPVVSSTTTVLPPGGAGGTSNVHAAGNSLVSNVVFLILAAAIIVVAMFMWKSILRPLLWQSSSDLQSPREQRKSVRKESSAGFSRRRQKQKSADVAEPQGDRSQGISGRFASGRKGTSSRYGVPSEEEQTDASVRSSRGYAKRNLSSEPPQQDRENLKEEKKDSKGNYRHRRELAANHTDDAALTGSDIAL